MTILYVLFIFMALYLAKSLFADQKVPGLSFWAFFLALAVGLGLNSIVAGLAGKAILIFLIPLLSFWTLMFFGKKTLPGGGDWIAVAAIGVSFVLSYAIYNQAMTAYGNGESFFHNVGIVEWISFTNPDTGIRTPWKIGFWIDELTAVMLMVVCIVSFLVHVFSMGYMKGEDNYSRYFGYLGLFSFSMLVLVLTDNLFILYCSWELVGVSSFLLIGFFINKEDPPAAAKKAFVTNRVGDLGFAIGLYLIYSNLHTFSFTEIFEKIGAGEMSGWTLTITGVCLFCGAMGKSAQFPLHIWLPDAMEGPTPVSALIHAATMVAAGVYMVARLFPVFSPDALLVVAYIGTFTAVTAATIAITQYDIKRVLAYSTLSQLGYMVAALGVGAYTAALFHLTTHAFFKSLLFLCSGSVIHAMHHEQDMRNMGGLAGKIPITFLCMTIGTIAISGVPFFSGFYSKDMILAGALEKGMVDPHHMIIFLSLLVAAGVTAFYMFRLIFMTFTGEPRDRHAYDHAHESPALMWVPLALLAILSVTAGYEKVGLGGFFHERIVPHGQEIVYGGHGEETHANAGLLTQTAYAAEEHAQEHSEHAAAAQHGDEGHGQGGHDDLHHKAHIIAMTLSIIVATAGILLSAFTYWERIRVIDPAKCARALGPVYDLVYNKYYVDEFYARTLYKGTEVTRNFLAKFDLGVIDGVVNGSATVTKVASNRSGWFDNKYIDGIVNWMAVVCQRWGARAGRIETGVIQNYVLKVGGAFGTIVVLWMVIRSLTSPGA